MTLLSHGSDARSFAWLAICCFLLYNANGREIGSADSQPTKYAARELLLRGTLGLNHVVGSVPQLAERSAFVLARDRRYRSAYSPVPPIAAAAIAWPFWKTGLIDIRAPLAPALIASLGASVLASLTVGMVFLTARRILSPRRAFLVAAGFAVGTGMWDTVSQTLWQHETAIFGLTLAMLAFTRDELRPVDALVIGIGLALTGSSRMQLTPAIAVVLAGTAARGGWRVGIIAAAIVGAAATATARVNILWFGSPLGAAPLLEALHVNLHGTSQTFAFAGGEGFIGLLVSPSRGILVFSPLVLLAAGGARAAIRAGWRAPLAWCAAAAGVQYVFYGMYSVWWAGHTYGPRYMLDVLPFLVPLAVAAALPLRGRLACSACAIAFAWSTIASGTGAFFYPNDRWNTHPGDIDRVHTRLWDWSDTQIVRCWNRGPSPQNFNLFTRAAFRRDP